MLEWLLKGCAVEALGQFLAAKANSSEARTAERLGKFLLHNQFAGISDQGSPEAALSAYYCGHVHMEDDMKRTAFHTTVAVGSADMLKFLIKTTRAMGKFDATLVSDENFYHCQEHQSYTRRVLVAPTFSDLIFPDIFLLDVFASTIGYLGILGFVTSFRVPC